MCAEHFIAIAFVKSLNKRILVQFTWLDVTDLYAVLSTPVDEGLSTELRAIVTTNRCGFAMQFNQLVQQPDHTT